MASSELRLAVFPEASRQNPYSRLLHAALERRGVRIVRAPGLRRGWSRRAEAHVDAVHLHWIEFLYGAAGAGLAHKRAASVLAALHALRRSPVRVVWTVHNLRPHEARFPWLVGPTTHAALRASDAIVVHSEHAARRLSETVDSPVAPTVLAHPHYIGAYPEPRERAVVRAELGLPEGAFTYLIFGQLRRYKRVPEAIAAFRRLDDPGARLIVAGAVQEEALAGEIAAARAGDERVLLRIAPVPDAAVSDLHAAADAVILHYRDVFSSGALLLALSFGLPVVAPAGTTATEIAEPLAVEPYGEDPVPALAAIQRGERREPALASARRHGWDAMADGLVDLYRSAA